MELPQELIPRICADPNCAAAIRLTCTRFAFAVPRDLFQWRERPGVPFAVESPHFCAEIPRKLTNFGFPRKIAIRRRDLAYVDTAGERVHMVLRVRTERGDEYWSMPRWAQGLVNSATHRSPYIFVLKYEQSYMHAHTYAPIGSRLCYADDSTKTHLVVLHQNGHTHVEMVHPAQLVNILNRDYYAYKIYTTL